MQRLVKFLSAARNFIIEVRDQILSEYQFIHPKAPVCASIFIQLNFFLKRDTLIVVEEKTVSICKTSSHISPGHGNRGKKWRMQSRSLLTKIKMHQKGKYIMLRQHICVSWAFSFTQGHFRSIRLKILLYLDKPLFTVQCCKKYWHAL